MKPVILIPVYNNQGLLEPLIEELLQITSLDIFVVDDGSDPAVFFENSELRLKLHRFPENQGKGVALTWALQNLAQDYSHIISMDGDGQHLPKDIPKFVSAIEKHPEALVIGCREFSDGVPGISKFGRGFSNFWVKYQTGFSVRDSQSGFRAYPLLTFQGTRFFTRRYDFEIEVLVRGLWKGVPLHEISIDVHYPPEEERVSHFHKFKDNARITCLNIWLIAYSLIFYQKSFLKILAVALASVPLSFVPSFWMGAFLGILTCVVLRFNVILMILCLLVLRSLA